MTNIKSHLINELQPFLLEQERLDVLIVGGGSEAWQQIDILKNPRCMNSVTIVAATIDKKFHDMALSHSNFFLFERDFEKSDLSGKNLVIIVTGNVQSNRQIRDLAIINKIRVHSINSSYGDVVIKTNDFNHGKTINLLKGENGEKKWKRIATYSIISFGLMVLGHLIISALPISTVQELVATIKPYFNYQFLFFVIAGFVAQMVDGALSMGYGVTSATCLMSFGVNPVSVSAAIHTSEIFTTGISGYSHYKFGNVNKKLFRHLVIPGVIGAIFGALLLVFLGEKAGKYLMPLIALYAMFLGLKILLKAFRLQKKSSKVKRVGWLAAAGGFFDSFGGGGWGPIVTSTLVSKGRDPKYTVGSVCLTEFFVTLASATTFFLTVGVSHWHIVLGLIIGGSIAAPFAAKLAGRLPRKTMMIAVGIIVIIWCIRMFVKSITSI